MQEFLLLKEDASSEINFCYLFEIGPASGSCSVNYSFFAYKARTSSIVIISLLVPMEEGYKAPDVKSFCWPLKVVNLILSTSFYSIIIKYIGSVSWNISPFLCISGVGSTSARFVFESGFEFTGSAAWFTCEIHVSLRRLRLTC